MAVSRAPASRPLLVERPGALDAQAEAEVARAAASVFQGVGYARALDAVRGDARLLRAPALGHALVREESAFGFLKWNGVAVPAVAPGADPAALFEAVLLGAREASVASIAWREPTLTRFPRALVEAAQAAAERTGARATLGELETRVVDLQQAEDAQLAAWDRKHRNALRSALRLGVTVERPAPSPFLDAFLPLAEATWARSGRSGPSRASLEALLAGAPWAWPFLARDAAGAPVAAALVAVDGARATYLHGASVPGARGAGQLLQWRAMRDLAAAGVEAYDLGGGPVPGSWADDAREQGIRRFKEGFGGVAQRWPTVQVAPDPTLYEEARAAALRASQAKQG